MARIFSSCELCEGHLTTKVVYVDFNARVALCGSCGENIDTDFDADLSEEEEEIFKDCLNKIKST